MSIKDGFGGINVESKDQLDTRVLVWKKVVLGVAVGLVGAYLFYFGLYLDLPPAKDADKWGAFGDFVGGLLNPIVAFAAFFWLTESVKLQKQELAETRAELKSAAEAQQLLARNSLNSMRLAAMTSLTSAAQTRVDMLNRSIDKQSEFLRTRDAAIEEVLKDELEKELRNMERYRSELFKDLDAYFWEMREILDLASGRSPNIDKGGDVTNVK